MTCACGAPLHHGNARYCPPCKRESDRRRRRARPLPSAGRRCECGVELGDRAALGARYCLSCAKKHNRRSRKQSKEKVLLKDDHILDERMKQFTVPGGYLDQFDAWLRTSLGKEWALREVWPTINHGEPK